MVIDSSALIAILNLEPETEALSDAIAKDNVRLVSAASLLETSIVLLYDSDSALRELEALIRRLEIEIVPVDEAQARFAIEAARLFGKGRHPAGLNYGDCFVYALSRQSGEPLLFKGNDFARTDVARVL